MTWDDDAFRHLVTFVQDGVVARRQLGELGAGPHDVRRMLRQGRLVPVYPGVYVTHNGPLTWEQRAWAAVQHYWPAVLAFESALPDPDPGAPVRVAIAPHRTLAPVRGAVAHRMAGLATRTRPLSSPPRLALEHAAIDVAAEQPDAAAALRVLADVCRTRETSAAAIADTLRHRRGVAHRAVLLDLLADLAAGACSVLEREYLRLERSHGLPRGDRQRPDRIGGRRAHRDVHYRAHRTVVELDGRAHHDPATARDRDFERDLDTAVDAGDHTVRLTYGQAMGRGCHTIRRIAVLLQRRGWDGEPMRCPSCPSCPSCSS